MMNDFITSAWQKLVLANYEVDPSILQPYVPFGTELDLYQDKCFVTLIGFIFSDVKVLNVAVPFYQNFEEVNVRIYVKRVDKNNAQPGIVFLRELVNRAALTVFANKLFFQHYRSVPMKHDVLSGSEMLHAAYSWKMNNRWQMLSVESDQQAIPVEVGSEEDFLLHRFYAYTKVDHQRTIQHEISHPRWMQYPVQNGDVKADFGAIVNHDLHFLNQAKPHSFLFAEGSSVAVVGQQVIPS